MEEMLESLLLFLACRHHVFELHLGAVFKLNMGHFSCPDITLFKNFKEFWPKIDKTKYVPGVSEIFVKRAISDDKEEVVSFVLRQLEVRVFTY